MHTHLQAAIVMASVNQHNIVASVTSTRNVSYPWFLRFRLSRHLASHIHVSSGGGGI